MKHLFILNPTAGGGRKISIGRTQILQTMAQQDLSWELYETTAPKDATRKIQETANEGAPLRVYACGGDGTLNECVNAAVGVPHVAVTSFPLGTGNDFIKSFSDGGASFFHLPSLITGREIALDVIDTGGHFGLNICSVGLDARIANDVHNFSWIPGVRGKSAYYASLVSNVLRGISEELEVTVNDLTLQKQFTLICVCNGRHYGGAFTPVPDARPDDGLLDILLVNKVSRRAVGKLVKTYAKGAYQNIPHLITPMRASEISIRAAQDFTVNIDGETYKQSEVHFRVLPAALRFFAPQKLDFT